MYVDVSDTGIVPFLLTYGIYGPHLVSLFEKMIKPDMHILDIGANFGYYTLLAAKLVGDKGKIYSFEPDPKNYKLLIKNIQLNNLKNVMPIQKAVSNKNGKTTLFLDKTNLGKHSFSNANISDKAGFKEVETTTLDTFFKNNTEGSQFDFIKIDVEGAEGLIIDGAKNILQSNKNLKITMEFWPYGQKNIGTNPLTLLNYLKECGFKVKIAKKMHLSVSPSEIIELCEKINDGKGSIDLFFEK